MEELAGLLLDGSPASRNGAGISQHALLAPVAGFRYLLQMPGVLARTIGVSNRSEFWVYVKAASASIDKQSGYAKAVPPNFSSVFPVGPTQFVSFLVDTAPDGTPGPAVANPVIDVSASSLPCVAVQDSFLESPSEALDYLSTFIGAIDGPTGNVAFTTPSGIPAGPLPPPALGPPPDGNQWTYVVCSRAGGIPSGPAAGIIVNVGDWLYSDGFSWAPIRFGLNVYPSSPYVTYTDPVYARSRPYTALLPETAVMASGAFATLLDYNYLLPAGRISASYVAANINYNIYPNGGPATTYALEFALSLSGPFLRRDLYRFAFTPQPAYMGGGTVSGLIAVSGPNPRIQLLVRDTGGNGCRIVGGNSADSLWASTVALVDLGPASGTEIERLPPRGIPLPSMPPAVPRSYFRQWGEYYTGVWRTWSDLGRRRSAPAIAYLRRVGNGFNGNGRIRHGK